MVQENSSKPTTMTFDNPQSRSEAEQNHPYKSDSERLEAEGLLGEYKLLQGQRRRERLDQQLAANQLEIPSHLPEWHKAWLIQRQEELRNKG